ncbi:unnamed protein product, partial [marine sediment metagenome]
IIIGMIIYFITAYFNKLFSDEERAMINSAIGKNLWVF